MRLEWAATARRDRLSIFNHIDQHRPASARRAIGPRELVLHEEHILIYRIDADIIRILRILHAARRWP